MWLYEVCPESIRPFWISRDPVAWPWCNSAASHRRPYYVSVNSHSPVGLVSRQWDAVDWAYVLCDRHIHKSPPFQKRFYLWDKSEVSRRQMWAVRGWQTWVMWSFAKKKNQHENCRMGMCIVVMNLICSLGHFECDGHTAHKLGQASHCRLTSPTGEWLFTDAQYGLLWLVAKLHQGRTNGSRDFQNGPILSGQPSCVYDT